MKPSQVDLHRFCVRSRRDELEEALERLSYREFRGVATWDDHQRMADIQRKLVDMDYAARKVPTR